MNHFLKKLTAFLIFVTFMTGCLQAESKKNTSSKNKSPTHELFKAIHKEDTKKVEEILSSGIDINQPIDFLAEEDKVFFEYIQFTPLIYAMHFGNKEIIELIANSGAQYSSESFKVIYGIRGDHGDSYTETFWESAIRSKAPVFIFKKYYEPSQINEFTDAFWCPYGDRLLRENAIPEDLMHHLYLSSLNAGIWFDAMEEKLTTLAEAYKNEVISMNLPWADQVSYFTAYTFNNPFLLETTFDVEDMIRFAEMVKSKETTLNSGDASPIIGLMRGYCNKITDMYPDRENTEEMSLAVSEFIRLGVDKYKQDNLGFTALDLLDQYPKCEFLRPLLSN